MPPLTIETFRSAFQAEAVALNVNWETVGFYGTDGRVYPFGTDTKVLSSVFESLSAPLIATIAKRAGYIVETSEQTVYPDFTLSPAPDAPARIAIDIKTTYRRFSKNHAKLPFRYTLGSYTSFLRSEGAKKNIKYVYSDYTEHWVIGFLYTRRDGIEPVAFYKPEDVSSDLCPYADVDYFI